MLGRSARVYHFVMIAQENPIAELLVGFTIIAQSLVDKPSEIRVVATHTAMSSAITLHCAASDMAKVIGKQGRTARSLRIILSASAKKCGRSITLDIPAAGVPVSRAEN